MNILMSIPMTSILDGELKFYSNKDEHLLWPPTFASLADLPFL